MTIDFLSAPLWGTPPEGFTSCSLNKWTKVEKAEIKKECDEQTANLPSSLLPPSPHCIAHFHSLPLLEFVWWGFPLCLENYVFLPASHISFISEVVKKNNNNNWWMYPFIPGCTLHTFVCELKLARSIILFDYFNLCQTRFYETNSNGDGSFDSSSLTLLVSLCLFGPQFNSQ